MAAENSKTSYINCNVSGLMSLPKDLFNKIGSYLPLKGSMDLSITSHGLRTMVCNDSYFDQFKKQSQKLKLTDVILIKIYENDGSLEFFKHCEQLYIGSRKNINCLDNNGINDEKCILHKIISKIENGQQNNESCNLLWFRFIISNIEQLFVSDEWLCAFKHIPMSWIFDKKPLFNPNQKFPEISIVGEYNVEKDIPRKWNKPAAMAFANEFEKYWLLLSNKSKEEKEKEKEKEKGKSTSRMSNVNNVRPICRLWVVCGGIGPASANIFELLLKLHRNFTGLTIPFPCFEGGIESLNHFFEIFHSNVKRLELLFSSQAINVDVLSQIFKFGDIENIKNNLYLELMADLETSEDELSFEKLLEKYNVITVGKNKDKDNNIDYNYNYNSILPQIRTLCFIFNGTIPEIGVTVKSLINQEKLIKLLNIEESVTEIISLMWLNTCKNSIVEAFTQIINKLSKLTCIEFRFRIVSFQLGFEHVSRVYKESLSVWLINAACAKNIKIVTIQLGRPRYYCCRKDEFVIEIENQELLYTRKNELKERIEKCLDRALKNVQSIWSDEGEHIAAFRRFVTQRFVFIKRFQL